jgi:flagellar export protein FliJ
MQQRIERFSRLLKLRENDRRTEQIVLAEERSEEETILRRLDSLGKERAQAMDDFRRTGQEAGTVSRQEIWFQRQTIDVVEKHLDKNREQRDDVRRRIAATEERLAERHREARLMEGYVDRLKTDAFKAFIDAEQSELDDIALTRHARASSKNAPRPQKDSKGAHS